MRHRLFCFSLVLAALIGAFARADEPADRSTETLRVLTHNVYYSFTRENEPHYEQWREWMAEQAPDVVSLQELWHYKHDRLADDAKSWGHEHSVLHREQGMSVGMTSRWPITEVKRLDEGFMVPTLRGKTNGVYFYCLHFYHNDREQRVREAELTLKDIATLGEGARVVLAGDFNGFSPADREYYDNNEEIIPFFQRLDARRNPPGNNLKDGRMDYRGIEVLLEQGYVDLYDRFRPADAKFTGTFPTPLVAAGDHGPDRRLDYIFVSPNLVKAARSARILRDETTAKFSDHFPVVAELKLENSR